MTLSLDLRLVATILGCYHIYLMLKPANARVAFFGFLLGTFGFMVGVVWIGSRASVSALAQLPLTPDIEALIQLLLIIANFVLFFLVKDVGKHSMPIALNVAFFIFFALSFLFSFKANRNSTLQR